MSDGVEFRIFEGEVVRKIFGPMKSGDEDKEYLSTHAVGLTFSMIFGRTAFKIKWKESGIRP